MSRLPFVWEVQVRRELLEDELTQLRELPYSLWRDLLGRPMRKQVRGRDNRAYSVKTMAEWVRSGSSNIRVTVALESGKLRRRVMTQTFVITPENALQNN